MVRSMIASVLLLGAINILLVPSFGDLWQLAPPAHPVPASLFGMHMHYAGKGTPWPSVPMAEWRLWDAYVSWADLEPQKGEWHFETLDRYVALAEEHHAGILLVLGQSPAWASARPRERSPYHPGNAAEPENVGDWHDYVQTIAARYKGRILGYEIWNEPNLKQFWTGSVDQMIALAREASDIIHNVDPTANVVSPSAVGRDGITWLAKFLADGGRDSVDVIGFHFYVTPAAPESMLPVIRRVQRVMSENGVQDKPLWNTETGWSDPKPFPSEGRAAAYLARSYILNWAAGVERLYWYSWDNHRWVSLQTTETDNRTLKPAGRAYEAIHNWLVTAQFESCKEDSHHTWICVLNRDGAPEWIVWNPRGPRTFSVPEQWHASTITPLLEQAGPLTQQELTLGPAPALLTSAGH
jgi:glycosyl hydrolase family 39 (putative alpha-L-iduronidase)